MKRSASPDPKQTSKKRLRLRKELLRNLSKSDLEQIQGGIGCPVSIRPPPGGCGLSRDL